MTTLRRNCTALAAPAALAAVLWVVSAEPGLARSADPLVQLRASIEAFFAPPRRARHARVRHARAAPAPEESTPPAAVPLPPPRPVEAPARAQKLAKLPPPKQAEATERARPAAKPAEVAPAARPAGKKEAVEPATVRPSLKKQAAEPPAAPPSAKRETPEPPPAARSAGKKEAANKKAATEPSAAKKEPEQRTAALPPAKKEAEPPPHATEAPTEAKPAEPSACQLHTAEIAVIHPLPPITGPGECGAEDVVRLEAVIGKDGRRIPLNPAATLRCPMAEAVAHWIREDVTPLAQDFGAALKAVGGDTSFDCRSRNHIKGAKLSEHGHANALDLRGFTLANGKFITLTDVAVDRAARERLRHAACERFTTVLGPGSDGYHETHIHLDLIQRRGGYKMCQWDVRDQTVATHVPMPPERPSSAPPPSTRAAKSSARE